MSCPVEVKTATVYVVGGKKHLTMLPAYRRAAWKLIRGKHCHCNHEYDEEGALEKSEVCRFHSDYAYYGQRVVSRLVRLWLLRDKAPRSVYSRACLHKDDDWGRVPLPDGSKVLPVQKAVRLYCWAAGKEAMDELRARHPEEYRDLFLAVRAKKIIEEKRDR